MTRGCQFCEVCADEEPFLRPDRDIGKFSCSSWTGVTVSGMAGNVQDHLVISSANCARSLWHLAELRARLAKTLEQIERSRFLVDEDARKLGIDFRMVGPPAGTP